MNAFLHSHVQRYPLRYDDDRVSSQGQQVTGYPHKDVNNWWIVKPGVPDIHSNAALRLSGDLSEGEPLYVNANDIIRLEHVSTKSDLSSHDVASPLTVTNQEVTTIRLNETHGDNDTDFKNALWRVEIMNGNSREEGGRWKGLTSNIRLVHLSTNTALICSKDTLPEWGFKQMEINTHKRMNDPLNRWVVLDHQNAQVEAAQNRTAEVSKRSTDDRPGIFSNIFELIGAMLRHNGGLTSSHPYATRPFAWPTLKRGIAFWQEGQDRRIYLLGNPITWLMGIVAVGVSIALWISMTILQQRGLIPNDIYGKVAAQTGHHQPQELP